MPFATLIKVFLGFLALILATIGLLIPVWPTTPFVLVAVGCFSSTPELQKKLLGISFFREYYESYTLGKGICRKTTVSSLSFLWTMLMISMVFTGKLWVSVLLSVIGIAVTIHILMISRERKNL